MFREKPNKIERLEVSVLYGSEYEIRRTIYDFISSVLTEMGDDEVLLEPYILNHIERAKKRKYGAYAPRYCGQFIGKFGIDYFIGDNIYFIVLFGETKKINLESLPIKECIKLVDFINDNLLDKIN